LIEIELPVLERPSGEFARLRRAEAPLQKSRGDTVDHCLAAVEMKLCAVFAGVTTWPSKEQCQSRVEPLSVSVTEPSQPDPPR